jgi:hypothetical protein
MDMRAGLHGFHFHTYPADKARHREIILRRPWQRIVFFGGLVLPILVVLVTLLTTAAGH